MNSIRQPFQPLLKRLYDLTKDSEYLPNFDFVRLIKALEAEVVLNYSDAAHEEINRCLVVIDKISQGDLNFFSRFRVLAIERISSHNEYGNECFEEQKNYTPLPDSEKDRINNEILVELRYYVTVLQQMKNFSNYDTGKQNSVPKNEKPNLNKSARKLSFGFRHKGKEDLLSEVYWKCETNNGDFINKETDEDTFKQVLTAKNLSSCNKPIQLGCETKQAVYIFDKLADFFQNLTPTIIGKCGLFRTREGKILTANNIYNARKSNERVPPKDYTSIDDFFDSLKKFPKKY